MYDFIKRGLVKASFLSRCLKMAKITLVYSYSQSVAFGDYLRGLRRYIFLCRFLVQKLKCFTLINETFSVTFLNTVPMSFKRLWSSEGFDHVIITRLYFPINSRVSDKSVFLAVFVMRTIDSTNNNKNYCNRFWERRSENYQSVLLD